MWSGIGCVVMFMVMQVVDGNLSSEARTPQLPYQLPGAYNLVADKLDPKILEMELAGVLPQQQDEKPEMEEENVFNMVQPAVPTVPRRQVCWCCRAYVCHYQRCPCSKFML
ncbi:unnamed protein product [Bursaphelenchus okinawaensis]|uniref:Uncharacterized protein n=1 Tax=Bursaphelenchus okinawaensis TaxID=465554 RepID=A0A811KPV9_9BILA|nr:unnamed protein product [Bursaphelenchus okinawaensis]CAG9107096.1 unnamed protein product [Bursaphelenchus okinawaensis]